MSLLNILSFARISLQNVVQLGDIVVDATVGNGYDTVFLAELVGEIGHVYGFDIQKKAIDQTSKKLEAKGLNDRVSLFDTGHEHVFEMLPIDVHGKIKGAIFNLGYLPRGNKEIITQPETTISAVDQLLNMLTVGGIIILVVYHGHDGGANERNALLSYTEGLAQEKFHVLKYSFINQINDPPFIIAIEKR